MVLVISVCAQSLRHFQNRSCFTLFSTPVSTLSTSFQQALTKQLNLTSDTLHYFRMQNILKLIFYLNSQFHCSIFKAHAQRVCNVVRTLRVFVNAART
jgi:hypothetical protein